MKEESKTIREWLMMLKEPYRSEAIRNAEDGSWNNINLTACNLYSALSLAFDWELAIESRKYWKIIYDSITRGSTDYLAEEWMPKEGTITDKTKPIPREVEVTLHGFWQKTELIADLSEFNVERPYVVRHITRTNETMMYSNIKEIEEKKEPISFGQFFSEGDFFPAHLDSAYIKYQEYLKQFAQ